jgi:hypothetical protein
MVWDHKLLYPSTLGSRAIKKGFGEVLGGLGFRVWSLGFEV